jgi:ArsR family metal-binding transcriptional regulator
VRRVNRITTRNYQSKNQVVVNIQEKKEQKEKVESIKENTNKGTQKANRVSSNLEKRI